MKSNLVIIFGSLLFFIHNASFGQTSENIALTPTRGWNSWNCFLEDISEEKIKSMADAMVFSGRKDAGYEYINIDDGWASKHLIGPDDSYKNDNQANPKGFRQERNAFFSCLKENDIPVNGFFFVNDDRHWQYHSIDVPTGYQKFSTGTFNGGNSRMGKNPGDPKGTDPNANQVIQVYTSKEPSGGFLHFKVDPEGSRWESPRVTFEFKDERGVVIYSTYVDAPGK